MKTGENPQLSQRRVGTIHNIPSLQSALTSACVLPGKTAVNSTDREPELSGEIPLRMAVSGKKWRSWFTVMFTPDGNFPFTRTWDSTEHSGRAVAAATHSELPRDGIWTPVPRPLGNSRVFQGTGR